MRLHKKEVSREEVLDIKSVNTLFKRYYAIQKFSALSNELLSIHVAQGAAEKLKIKVEGPKKSNILDSTLRFIQ